MISEIERHRDEVAELCRRASARRLDAFGSAARGDFDYARSDIDFLVEFEPLAPAELADAFFLLKDSLTALFGRRVDLITDRSLENPFFRRRVLSERQTVYAR